MSDDNSPGLLTAVFLMGMAVGVFSSMLLLFPNIAEENAEAFCESRGLELESFEHGDGVLEEVDCREPRENDFSWKNESRGAR